MDIRYFEYLREINRCKSFKKAEKQLHISAQQLGRIVTTIEEEFGVTIFERTNLGLRLTKEGEEFLTMAKALLDVYQSLYQRKDEQENSLLTGTLTICASINTWPIMGELVATFANRYPGIAINYRMCTDMELLDNVERYEDTIGILFRIVVKGPSRAGGYRIHCRQNCFRKIKWLCIVEKAIRLACNTKKFL